MRNQANFLLFNGVVHRGLSVRFWIHWVDGEIYSFAIPGWLPTYSYTLALIVFFPVLRLERKVIRFWEWFDRQVFIFNSLIGFKMTSKVHIETGYLVARF